VYPTAAVVTAMWLGTSALVMWDLHRWRGVLRADGARPAPALPDIAPTVDLRLWQACGAGILTLYLAVCALSGGIYRPKGFDPSAPPFYVFPAIALLPVITLIVDRARHRRRAGAG
jgi:hypothetical protein